MATTIENKKVKLGDIKRHSICWLRELRRLPRREVTTQMILPLCRPSPARIPHRFRRSWIPWQLRRSSASISASSRNRQAVTITVKTAVTMAAMTTVAKAVETVTTVAKAAAIL